MNWESVEGVVEISGVKIERDEGIPSRRKRIDRGESRLRTEKDTVRRGMMAGAESQWDGRRKIKRKYVTGRRR